MKVILIPELLLDKEFDAVFQRVEVWKQISANRPEILVEHFRLEINRLRNALKEAQ